MATKRVIVDKDFDKIIVRTHRLARNITMRTKSDGLYVTTPPYTTLTKVMEVVEKFRQSLLEKWSLVKKAPIAPGFNIDAPCFKLSVIEGNYHCFTLKHVEEKTVIMCPSTLDYAEKKNQNLLTNAIIRALKRRAAEYLPPLLNELSYISGLHYNKIKITGSRSRWGSCSAAKSINLSCYLMLLPSHLMEYVLLHELSHTKEMNHGPQFWELLDSVTDGRAQSLRKELRVYSTKLYF